MERHFTAVDQGLRTRPKFSWPGSAFNSFNSFNLFNPFTIFGSPAPGRALSGFVAAMLAAHTAKGTGTWVPITRPAPGPVCLMLLLPDGTVMAANQPFSAIGRAWYRLTPDSHGSYVNGTWSTLSSMHDSRLWYSSQGAARRTRVRGRRRIRQRNAGCRGV
jgi:hypothetical protein